MLFRSNDLTAEELQTLTLHADLAVLSACNTGFGKISKGEGVMSLARAFNYAGVPATVTTLWRVPDEETSRLMVGFYTHLKAGMTKDAALRQAKLDYLDNLKFDTKAAPLYWSAFIVSGNTDAVSFDTPLLVPMGSIWVYLGIGLAFMIPILLFFKFKISK